MKTALITGITGQNGSYLRSSSSNTGRIDHIYQDKIIRTVQPDEMTITTGGSTIVVA
jgi:GDP-D-mannose dehydratase